MATFAGTPGNDVFTGGADGDSASGGAGADRLAGGPGSDTIDGGPGEDRLYSGDASPTFNLPYAGNPYVFPLLDTGAERDTLIGGDASDQLFAGYGDNVDGGEGGAFGDYLFISFMGAPAGVTADFGQASQTIGGGVITGIENISYVQGSRFNDNINVRSSQRTGYSDFTAVSGMDGNDTLAAGYYTGSMFGDGGDDVVDGRESFYLFLVDGGAGNDTLHAWSTARASGGAGDDMIYGEAEISGGFGNDTIVMASSPYGNRVTGDEGDDKVTAADSGNRIAGGAGADTLTGAAGSDFLVSAGFTPDNIAAADDGGLERDRLSGGGGGDTLAIGFGDDADGGAGTDTLRLSLAGSATGVDVDLSAIATGAAVALGGGTIQGVESLAYLRGTEFADRLKLPTQAGVVLTINSGAGDDVITAQGGAVSLMGGDGNDRLVSGTAADVFDGGTGTDTIDYSGFTAAVSVNLKTGAGAGGDSLVRVEAAIGTALNDTLVGSGAGSTVTGGAGDDRVELGARDAASLGAGADVVQIAAGAHSASSLASVIRITDWTAEDKLQFGAATGAYTETTAADFASAVRQAELQEAAGYNFVAVQVGADVYVFGQPIGQRLHFDEAVRLVGANLDSVSASNIGLPGPLETPITPAPNPGTGGGGGAGEPVLPGAPSAGVGGASGTITGDMDRAHISHALNAVITDATTSLVVARVGDVNLRLEGFGFSSDGAGNLTGGTATSIAYSYGVAHGGPFSMTLNVPQTPLTTLAVWLVNDSTQTMFNSILGGSDRIAGGTGGDLLRGNFGADLISGGGGSDTLWGGGGNDVIYGQAAPGGSAGFAGSTYLRGDEGDDYIVGGTGFDDINGNMGNDTGSGGVGDDWVVGGRDNDLLFGDAGGDLVYGNLGADTCVGGEGDDIVRGGQDNDLVYGGAGADFVSGDRGEDTMVGGAGADVFHTFSETGFDSVLDFSVAEGDRVMLDPGAQYAVAQLDGDTVVNMVGGGRLVLVGVQLATLPAGWIFGA